MEPGTILQLDTFPTNPVNCMMKLLPCSMEIEGVHCSHKYILYYSTELSKLLRSSFRPDSDAEDIMDEIGFLFCSSVQARQKVTVAIKVIIFALTLDLVLFMILSSLFLLAGFTEYLKK